MDCDACYYNIIHAYLFVRKNFTQKVLCRSCVFVRYDMFEQEIFKMRNRSASIEARQEILAAGELKTVKQLWLTAEHFHQDKIAIREMDGKDPVEYSYRQLACDIRALGTELMAEGMENKRVAILGENCYRWVVTYFATVSLGTVVPIDKELTEEDIKKLLEKGEVEAIFTSSKYLKTALNIKAELPSVKEVVLWTANAVKTEDVTSMDLLIEKGKTLLENGNRAFLDREISEDDVATVQFTSGTTGLNKGVQLTHRNICANINSLSQIIPIEMVSISVLPLNHTLESNCHVLPALYFGMTVCFNDSLKHLTRNLKTFHPGMSIVVPMFIDEIYNEIWINAKKTGREKKLKYALAISRALMYIGLDVRDAIFKDLFDILGGNLKLLICGGAPINPRTAKGLYDMGIDIANGYGITECAPLVTVNLEGRKNMESVGTAVPNVKVKIDKTNISGVGEILVQGDNVMKGYYNDPDSNARSFENGWFRTGDYGYLDTKGRLWIAGRKKNLIILDNGKNVFPEEIESTILSNLDYVKEIVVYETTFTMHSHKSHQIAATIRLKPDSEMAALSQKEQLVRVEEDIKKANHQLAVYKRITAFKITDKEFNKNAAHKIIRSNIAVKGEYTFL